MEEREPGRADHDQRGGRGAAARRGEPRAEADHGGIAQQHDDRGAAQQQGQGDGRAESGELGLQAEHRGRVLTRGDSGLRHAAPAPTCGAVCARIGAMSHERLPRFTPKQLTGRSRDAHRGAAGAALQPAPGRRRALPARCVPLRREDGIDLLPVSSFRDFDRQLLIWNGKVPRRARAAGPRRRAAGCARAGRGAARRGHPALVGAARRQPSPLGHGHRRRRRGALPAEVAGAAARPAEFAPGGDVRAARRLAGCQRCGLRVLPSLRARTAAACSRSPGT